MPPPGGGSVGGNGAGDSAVMFFVRLACRLTGLFRKFDDLFRSRQREQVAHPGGDPRSRFRIELARDVNVRVTQRPAGRVDAVRRANVRAEFFSQYV